MLFQKISNAVAGFGKGFLSAPKIIWQWGEKTAQHRLIVLGAAALAAVLLVLSLVHAFRAKAKKKKFSLLLFLLVLVLLCVGTWMARGQILAHQTPEAETVRLGDETAIAYGQYSLSRGISLTEPVGYVDPQWFLADDVLSFCVSEDTVIQLSGLQSVFGDRPYRWDRFERQEDYACLRAGYDFSVAGKSSTVVQLELFYNPNMLLSEEAWFHDAGETVEAETTLFGVHNFGAVFDFQILENTGDRITALVKRSESDEEMVCLAQQMGPDLLVAVSSANRSVNDGSGNWQNHSYAPGADPEEREFLLEPLQLLFDGELRLLHGLTEEQKAQILPDRIVDYPIGLSLSEHFSIPCRELIQMDWDHLPWNSRYIAELLQFFGPGPDGKEYRYTLVNLGAVNVNANEVTDADWAFFDSFDAAYRGPNATTDPKMSDFIGVKAVEYQNGWLIYLGSTDANGSDKQYYYLSMERLH